MMGQPCFRFAFRLAAMLGCTVRELSQRMDSKEFSAWLAFDQLYNLPDIFFQTATLAMAATAPYTKRQLKPGDFVPIFRPQRRPDELQSPEEGMAIMRSMMMRRQLEN